MNCSKNKGDIGELTARKYLTIVKNMKILENNYHSRYGEIDIILSLGEYSYVSNHVIMFHDKNAKEIVDGMKVGIDQQSLDQKTMTMKICKGIKVSYVQLEYTQIIAKILNGEIDAAVMNVDEVKDKNIISKLKSEKKYLVAVQREDSKSEFIKLCSDSKISTINNIDEAVGKISLTMFIKDESKVGSFGIGEDVQDLMPFSK